MPDSSFYAPGGAGATGINGLTDVTIIDPMLGEGIIYDGTEWINGDVLDVERALIKNPQAGRFYFSRNQVGQGGIGGYNAFLVPIIFASDVVINKFIVGQQYNPPSTQGNGGLKVRGYIYNSNEAGNPNNLHKDLGYFTIAPSDSGGGTNTQFTLATTTTIEANTLHWFGFAYGPVNPAAGNLGSWAMEYGGLTDPYFSLGVPDSVAPYMTAIAGLYNGSEDWSTFDFQNGTLDNNISNSWGFSYNVPRMGLRVNSVV